MVRPATAVSRRRRVKGWLTVDMVEREHGDLDVVVGERVEM